MAVEPLTHPAARTTTPPRLPSTRPGHTQPVTPDTRTGPTLGQHQRRPPELPDRLD